MRPTKQNLAKIYCPLAEEFKDITQTEFHDVLQRCYLSHPPHSLKFNDPNNVWVGGSGRAV
jgi:hypothetical protein